MNLKRVLKNGKLINRAYFLAKSKRDEFVGRRRCSFKGVYSDRSRSCEILCIVLAGYKNYLHGDVFARVERAARSDMDVCVVTSGKYSREISDLCARNGWSYLSTVQNSITLVQNVAISKHPHARFIFKLDEDIFVPEGYFDRMLTAYAHAKGGDYYVGVLAPLLPINGYGYMRILDKLGLRGVYTQKFEPPKYGAGRDKAIEADSDIAKFFWGEDGYVPTVKELNERFWDAGNLEERPCAIRFSIGAILFERCLWEDMGMFKVKKGSPMMGKDEIQLVEFCARMSRPIMVSENIVAGHFSFGLQNEAMKEYYLRNREKGF